MTAHADGTWSTTYAEVPAGTLLTATQTSDAGHADAGTSELAAAVGAVTGPQEAAEEREQREREEAEAKEREATVGGGSGGGGGRTTGGPTGSPTPPPPPTAPKTKIIKGPKKSSTATTAKFTFKAMPAAGAQFECRLDRTRWAKCSSPRTYKALKPGRHTFQVRAKADGVTGPVASYGFAVMG